jgi:hypothetical protein
MKKLLLVLTLLLQCVGTNATACTDIPEVKVATNDVTSVFTGANCLPNGTLDYYIKFLMVSSSTSNATVVLSESVATSFVTQYNLDTSKNIQPSDVVSCVLQINKAGQLNQPQLSMLPSMEATMKIAGAIPPTPASLIAADEADDQSISICLAAN